MEHPDRARVIVTQINEDGSSSYVERMVDAVTETDANGNPLFRGSLLWGTADGTGTVGPGQGSEPVIDPFFPGPGGTRFVFFTFLPQTSGAGDIDHYAGEEGAPASAMPGLADAFDADRPGKHITDTIDFVHVISGEMILELDREEVLVKEGDTIITRGVWHAWRNQSDKPCTVASVLVGTHRKDVP